MEAIDEDWRGIQAYLERGDQDAFRAVYERHSGALTRFAAGILGRPELAREVVAEAFARIVSRRPEPGRSFRAFAYTVVRRLALDRLRRADTRKRHLEVVPAPEPGDSPEEDVLAGERQSRVQRAVAALAPRHREVLDLYYGHDLSSAEVADIVGCTDQQVRSRLAYARRLVRQQLEDT